MAGKSKKSLFRRVNAWLHLWLGLASGLVVFVVCLTAALWVFRYEVWYFTEPYQRVEVENRRFQLPSVLRAKAQAFLKDQEPTPVTFTNINYGGWDKSVALPYTLATGEYHMLYLNPYSGEVIYHKKGPSAAEKFFIFVRSGHRFFFLPPQIGSPVVGTSCIIFVILLITGIIWWYPQKWTKATRDKSFTIKWRANWKRVNLDLHNVLGFYCLLIALALTISGIVYSFQWFDRAYHYALTGKEGKGHHPNDHPLSDTTQTALRYALPEDKLFQEACKGKPGQVAVNIFFPKEAKDPYEVVVNPKEGTFYKIYRRFFDQKTLQELPSEESRKFEELSVGEKIYKMNFDIHVGQIYGLPTRILAFFVSLIGASFPVTGFIIWWYRGKSSKPRIRQTSEIASA